MAVTITIVKDYSDMSIANMRACLCDVALDSSYPSGGYAVTAANVRMRVVLAAEALGGNTASQGYTPSWNTSTTKLQVFQAGGANALILVQNGTIGAGDSIGLSSNNSGNSVLVGGANITANNTVSGALPAYALSEVAATTDLHTLTFRVLFLGD